MSALTISNLERRFAEFDRLNPFVYVHFCHFTLEAIKAGRKRVGAKMVAERIRWSYFTQTKGDRFKLNNSYVAYYARKFIAEHPEHAGIFAMRKVVSDSWK